MTRTSSSAAGFLKSSIGPIVASLTVFCCADTFAAPPLQQGCFGRVSTVACDGSIPADVAAARRAKVSRGQRTSAVALPSAITSQAFHQVNGTLGEWSGTVNGTGDIHLILQISNHGTVISSVILAMSISLIIQRHFIFEVRRQVAQDGIGKF